MASSLLDLARPTQVTPSLSQQSAMNATAAAKPKTRFNDVLAQHNSVHRPAEPKAAKAEKPEPSAKADKPRKADLAKSKKNDQPVDETQPADDTTDDQSVTEEAGTEEAQASKPAEKPTKAKPSKEAKPADENTEADADDAIAEAGATDGSTDAKPVPELPTADESVDVDAIDAGKEKPVSDDKSDDEATAIDPAVLAAQLNPVQTSPDGSAAQPTDSNADATAEVVDVTQAGTKAQAQAAKAQAAAKPTEATDAEPELAVQPHVQKGQHAADDALLTDADEVAGAIALPPELAKADTKSTADLKLDPSAALQAVAAPHEKPSTAHTLAMPAVQQAEAPVTPRTVAEENVDRIVTSIHGDIATKGGTMQIRLDPPSLGAINVQISIDDGVMSASLQTNNDEATRLLSHNLAQLKSQLESAGVTVDRIQVKQATPSEQSSNSNNQGDTGDRGQNRDAGQDQSARQEQQRREMLQRMWAKLAGNGDPLDLVA